MTLTVEKEYSGMRLDAYLASVTEMSRSAAARLADSGEIKRNGVPVLKKQIVSEGDIIEYDEPDPEVSEVIAENIPLDIVYEDEALLVVNKPSGMVVHPAPGNYTGTLVNALLYHVGDRLSGIGGVIRPGIVHRIDKDTSGLLVVAKNDLAHSRLSEELGYHGIEREYHALVEGGFSEDAGEVDLPIGRHPVDRKRMAIVKGEGGREARTHYEVLERYGRISYLRLRLETGRTHQIRVHMSHLGHPLLGDPVYKKSKNEFESRHPQLFDGQMLHAKRLSFTHPISGERMEFEVPLPKNFEEALRLLRLSIE